MSHRGAGRGRGWLNLPKTIAPPKPGGNENDFKEECSKEHLPESQIEDLYPVDSKYSELISKIREISPRDDGIKFNQKMKMIMTHWNQCTDRDEVLDSLQSLYNECMHDMKFGNNLIHFLFCNSLILKKIHDVSVNSQFLGILQKEFEKDLNSLSRQAFRHCSHLIGDVFKNSAERSQITISQIYKLLVQPLYKCLNSLVSNGTLEDFSLIASLLHRNASVLKTEDIDAMEELCIHIRKLLIFENISKEKKGWLLLCLDLVYSPEQLDSKLLTQLYSDLLGEKYNEIFLDDIQNLSIQTNHVSKTLDQFTSDVNVLQIAQNVDEKRDNIKANYDSRHFLPEHNIFPESDIPNNAEVNNEYNDYFNRACMYSDRPEVTAGRPILGAGASHSSKNVENHNNWTNNSTGRVPKQKTGKGWEHDDRFHNDYE